MMELVIKCDQIGKITEIEFMGVKLPFNREKMESLEDICLKDEKERWWALMEAAAKAATSPIPMVFNMPEILGQLLLRGKVRCHLSSSGYTFTISETKFFLRVADVGGGLRDVTLDDNGECDSLFSEMAVLNNQLITIQREVVKANVSLKKAQSELAKKNRALVKSQKELEKAYAVKSVFLANMSHELRTPLHGIIGNSELLKDSSLDARQQGLLDDIFFSSSLMLEMVNDILDGSKLETQRYELQESTFPLVRHLCSAFNMLSMRAMQKQLEYHLEVEEGLPEYVSGDALHLGQVLINLLSNAVKFTDKGCVVCEVKQDEKGKIRFSVRDTGRGIPKKSIKKLFKPFVQLESSGKAGGTGLGLYISSRLVALMGGSLTVTSELGHGSVFSFTLPLEPHDGDACDPEDLSTNGMIDDADKHFGVPCLIVEDNVVNRKIMLKQLELLGMDCDWTGDGKEAVQKCREKKYRIIFMDYNLPGQNGLEATSEIRKIPGYTREDGCIIIATTASIFPIEIEASQQAGMDDFLPKPYRLEDLKLCLKKIFSTNKF
jgi:signal transduction histidine kinase/CheY-like chemotaxis protein